MRTYTVTRFKAHALAIMNGIAETGESAVITKRGRPLVRVAPFGAEESVAVPGRLAGALMFEDDVVSPLGAAAGKKSGQPKRKGGAT